MKNKKYVPIVLRPYQLLCIICSIRGRKTSNLNSKLKRIITAIKKNPDIPITLQCNAGDVFSYQDPGSAEDAPFSFEFNRKRDLNILYKLNLFPGATLPARIIFHRIFDIIKTISDICGGTTKSKIWQGCPLAKSGSYEKTVAKGITAIIAPRNKKEMKQDKIASLKEMYKAKSKKVRPHILLCSVCQIGMGVKAPYPDDNLPELIELIIKKPDTLITMAEGADWMMCAPCPHRNPKYGYCIIHKGSGGLPSQLRDLRVLEKLGLSFGSTMKAVDLYKLMFQKIKSTAEICRFDATAPSLWYDPCAPLKTCSPNFVRGRKELVRKLGI